MRRCCYTIPYSGYSRESSPKVTHYKCDTLKNTEKCPVIYGTSFAVPEIIMIFSGNDKNCTVYFPVMSSQSSAISK